MVVQYDLANRTWSNELIYLAGRPAGMITTPEIAYVATLRMTARTDTGEYHLTQAPSITRASRATTRRMMLAAPRKSGGVDGALPILDMLRLT